MWIIWWICFNWIEVDRVSKSALRWFASCFLSSQVEMQTPDWNHLLAKTKNKKHLKWVCCWSKHSCSAWAVYLPLGPPKSDSSTALKTKSNESWTTVKHSLHLKCVMNQENCSSLAWTYDPCTKYSVRVLYHFSLHHPRFPYLVCWNITDKKSKNTEKIFRNKTG